MDNLFRPDAFLWRWCSRILDIMVLSILWFFCSLPAVTTGAASAALYDAAVHGIRRDEPGAYARFCVPSDGSSALRFLSGWFGGPWPPGCCGAGS